MSHYRQQQSLAMIWDFLLSKEYISEVDKANCNANFAPLCTNTLQPVVDLVKDPSPTINPAFKS